MKTGSKWMVAALGVAIVQLAVVQLELGDARAEEKAASKPDAAAASAQPEPGSIEARVTKLREDARRSSKIGLQMLIGARGLQARQPKTTKGGDAAEHAKEQAALKVWVGKVDGMRQKLEAHLERVETIRVRLRKLRREDMPDDQADQLVRIEPGIENTWRALDRGVRELDVAWRRGVNQLDDPPKR